MLGVKENQITILIYLFKIITTQKYMRVNTIFIFFLSELLIKYEIIIFLFIHMCNPIKTKLLTIFPFQI